MKQTKNINFELLRDTILDYSINLDVIPKYHDSAVLCFQEQVPSEDSEILYYKKILTKNFNGLPSDFG